MRRIFLPLLFALHSGCQGDADDSSAPDLDGDGYTRSDCNDDDPEIHYGADELCDGVDNDCDGEIDEGAAADAPTWYADDDGDGYGSADDGMLACAQPTGHVEDASDCDDDDDTLNPAASEVCDGVDNDCDELIDDEDDSLDSSSASTWYADADGDGFGDALSSASACVAPSGYVAKGDDCDDADAKANPDLGCHNGLWSGDLELLVSMDSKGKGAATCLGDIELTVDQAGKPQVQGQGSCSFKDSLIDHWVDVAYQLEGSFVADDAIEGEVILGTLGALPWSGAFTEDELLQGEFTGGLTVFKVFKVDFDASFEAELK